MVGATWSCCYFGVFRLHHTTTHPVMSLHEKPYITFSLNNCTHWLHAKLITFSLNKWTNNIRRLYACLAVTCHRHFWQNDRGLLHETAVTRRWYGYRTKRVSTKSWPRRRTFSCRSCRDVERNEDWKKEEKIWATSRSRVRRSNPALSCPRSHCAFCLWLAPAPVLHLFDYLYFRNRLRVTRAGVQFPYFVFLTLLASFILCLS